MTFLAFNLGELYTKFNLGLKVCDMRGKLVELVSVPSGYPVDTKVGTEWGAFWCTYLDLIKIAKLLIMHLLIRPLLYLIWRTSDLLRESIGESLKSLTGRNSNKDSPQKKKLNIYFFKANSFICG